MGKTNLLTCAVSGGSLENNTLDYQSRDRKIDPLPLKGPVVQSIVSLMSLLRVNLLSVLQLYNKIQ